MCMLRYLVRNKENPNTGHHLLCSLIQLHDKTISLTCLIVEKVFSVGM